MILHKSYKPNPDSHVSFFFFFFLMYNDKYQKPLCFYSNILPLDRP